MLGGMPRIIVEISKAERGDIDARAKLEGVSPAALASWLLREKLAESAVKKPAETVPPQAA